MQNIRHCVGVLGRGPYSSKALCSRNFRQNAFLCEMFNVQDTDDFKKRVLASSTPVLVDFHADWCGPCKLLGPRLESAVAEKDGKVHLAKVDIDENTDLAIEYNVTAVPAVVAIKDGQIVDRFIGLQDEDKIKGFVDKILGSGKKS